MSWLRVDDGFTAHRKIAKLTDREFRVWMRILCYCAHQGSAHVDEHLEVKGLTGPMLERFRALCLLDQNGSPEEYEVHDWVLYSDAPIADKVAYYLSRHPQATGNEVVRAIAAKREVVLAEVKRQRGDGSPEPHPGGSPEPGEGDSPEPGKVVPSRPDPSRPQKPLPRAVPVSRPPAPTNPNGRPRENELEHIQDLIDDGLRRTA